jgi:hypothetical protein
MTICSHFNILLLLLLITPCVGFMPLIPFDVYIETLAVGLSLTALQSASSTVTRRRRRRHPILLRVGAYNTTQHVVTTTRDDQTEIVIPVWAGLGDQPYRYRRSGDVLLGFVRTAIPAAPCGIIQVHVRILMVYECCEPSRSCRDGGGPIAYRYRLFVETNIKGNDGNNNNNNNNKTNNTQPERRGLILWQVKPSHIFFVACWPRGINWDPNDWEVPKAAYSRVKVEKDDDDDIDTANFEMLQLPQPLNDGSNQTDSSAGALIEPDWDYYENVLPMSACFHVSGLSK